jgi:hypothetical protein
VSQPRARLAAPALGVSLLLALAGLLVLAACETHATGAYFAEQLTPSVGSKLGPVSSITCPERTRIENTRTRLICNVELADGRATAIHVTLDDSKGLRWRTPGVPEDAEE